MIVLNAEPFLGYQLRALYPHAHQILIVEGAYPASAEFARDGHSTDNTVAIVRAFMERDDPDRKVTLIQREGLWSGLTEQFGALTSHITGDYLWEIDADEFYEPEAIERVREVLTRDPSITLLAFKPLNFIFDTKYRLVSGRDFHAHYPGVYRVFRWKPGYQFVQHEPPTVGDEQGRNLLTLHPLDQHATARLGVFLYHYWAIFQDKVEMKARTYAKRGWSISPNMAQWAENWLTLRDPWHLQSNFRHRTWIERFDGAHPPAVSRLRRAIRDGAVAVTMRDNRDVEALLGSWTYRLKRLAVSWHERLRGLKSYWLPSW